MYVIRPVKSSDFDPLFAFAKAAAPGIISLPKRADLLEEKIALSKASFEKKPVQPGKEFYFFVLENSATKEIGGCSGILAKAGIKEPLYFFRETVENRSSTKVRVTEKLDLLIPQIMTDGPSELCALFLSRPLRQEGLGSFLSLTRLLFAGMEKERFDKTFIARIRGFITERKTSPFWDHVGRHFFDISFIELLKLMETTTSFIPDILPRHPIYICLLPKLAIQMIGKPHPRSKPALQMLKGEGFKKTPDIDFLDAGPTMQANREDIGIIKRLTYRRVQKVEKLHGGHNHFFIAKGEGKDFRATIGTLLRVREQKEDIILDEHAARLLDIHSGDLIATSPAHKRSEK